MVRLSRQGKAPKESFLSLLFDMLRRREVILSCVAVLSVCFFAYNYFSIMMLPQPWEQPVLYHAQELRNNRIYQIPMGKRLIQESREFFQTLAQHDADAWLRFGRGRIDVTQDEERRLVNATNYLAASILTRQYPPLPKFKRPDIQINCGDPIYAHALTGRLDPQWKIIVDLALFGYDVDLLEIRLLEYGDLVHKIVVPEQNLNFKGVPKPYLIPSLLEGRLQQFANVIDHYPQNVSELQKRVHENKMKQDDPDAYKITWTIPTSMRAMAFRYIRDKYGHLDQNNNSSQAVYVIQNDGDEIINRHALAHFRDCQLREPAKKVFFGGLMYKRNAAWLVHTREYRKRNRLPLGGPQRQYKYLRNFVWHLGPIIQSLRDRTEEGLRSWPRKRPPAGERSMGLLAANHLSNPSHPILDFIKHVSTVDAQPATGDAVFWEKAAAGTLSYLDMRNVTFYCENLDKTGEFRYDPHWIHVLSLGEKLSDYLYEHLPWAARHFSDRYPWLYRSDLFPMEQALQDCFCFGHCATALYQGEVTGD